MADDRHADWVAAFQRGQQRDAEAEGYGTDQVSEEDLDAQALENASLEPQEEGSWNVARVPQGQQREALAHFYGALGVELPEALTTEQAAQIVQNFYHGDAAAQQQFVQQAVLHVARDMAKDLPEKDVDVQHILLLAQREVRQALNAAQQILQRQPKGPTLEERIRGARHRGDAMALAFRAAEKQTKHRW